MAENDELEELPIIVGEARVRPGQILQQFLLVKERIDEGAIQVHDLGGSRHSQDTLEALNALISDATLDDEEDQRSADQFQGKDIPSDEPDDGQVLVYNTSEDQWEHEDQSGGTGDGISSLPDHSTIGGSTSPSELIDALESRFSDVSFSPLDVQTGITHGQQTEDAATENLFDNGILLPDKRIIFPPHRSEHVGVFDPVQGTYTSGDAHNQGGGSDKDAFAGGCLLSDGRVIFSPWESTEVGIFEPETDTYSDGPTHGENNTAFHGAVVLPDGRVIFPPQSSNSVGIFDPSDDSYTSGPTHGQGDQAFKGGQLLPDGRVMFVPDRSSTIGLFDPFDDSYSNGPTHGQGNDAFLGATLLPDGRVVMAPANASNVGLFDYSDDSYSDGPSSEGGFAGVSLLPDGRAALIPRTASNLGLFDPSDDSLSDGPAATGFSGATLYPDGRLFLTPWDSGTIDVVTLWSQTIRPMNTCLYPLVQNTL